MIRANLLLDTVSTTALDIFNSGNQQGQWLTPADVPRFLYTSLTDLCSGYGILSDLIVSDYGISETQATAPIIIQPTEIDPSYSADFLEQDVSGAYYMEFDILVKQVRTSKDIYFIRDVGLRIIYILHHTYRGSQYNQFSNAHAGTSPDLFIIGDNTIYPGTDCKCKWKYSGILRVSQQLLHFCLDSQTFFIPVWHGGFD